MREPGRWNPTGASANGQRVHELSIAQSIVDSVTEQASAHGGRRVLRIGVRIGDISGVNADALAFCFDLATKDTGLEGASLDVERIPARFRCQACGTEFPAGDFLASCPSCAGTSARLVAGDELALSFLEVE